MPQSSVELMAPAGSYEALTAAIQGGANSVYFGVEQLNMRTKSTHNFTIEDLEKIAAICKENGLKSYLTLNTIVYDHDIKLMQRICDEAQAAGITAIIASDHAVMNYCRKIGMTIHISTQTNVTNIETVEFYSVYADVMVLSRELSLMQVESIAKEIKRRQITGPSGELVRLEVFGHGALCMAVSGKCYLSLHSNFSSANRGACIQNCRKSYIVTDKDTGQELEIQNEYIMSAKDLCTINFLDKIIDAGVAVLKIEGRGRSADYVFKTTKCYREAIDSIQEGSYTQEKIDTWMNELSTVFNRGFWDGYYLGRLMGEWNDEYGSKATKRKIYVAKGITHYAKSGVAEFLMEAHDVKPGDEVLIIGPTTGVIEYTLPELFVDGQQAEKGQKGERITFKIDEKIRPSDKLYKWVDA
jgi:U32 family peptidase